MSLLAERCDHSKVELRYKDTVDNRRQYREQCLTCGSLIRHVKKRDIPPEVEPTLPPYDDNLQSAWWKSRLGEYERLRLERVAEQQEQWWSWYSDYLKTPRWQRKRELILMRANGVCEGCEDAQATQVHHLTYERVGDELLFDLVAICTDCHQRAHPDKDLARGGR